MVSGGRSEVVVEHVDCCANGNSNEDHGKGEVLA